MLLFSQPIYSVGFTLPRSHRRYMRTTNMLERLNEEIKRRTRVARLFPNEASLLRLAGEAENTEPGQIASLVVTPEHVFIMKLEEKQSAGYEPFEKVHRQVREKIILDRRNEVVDRVNAGLMQQVELSKTDEFIDFCLERWRRKVKSA